MTLNEATAARRFHDDLTLRFTTIVETLTMPTSVRKQLLGMWAEFANVNFNLGAQSQEPQ